MQHLPNQIKMHDKYKLLSPFSLLTLQQGAKGSLSDLPFSGIIQNGIPFVMNVVYIL